MTELQGNVCDVL